MYLVALTMKTSLPLQQGEKSTQCDVNLKRAIVTSKLSPSFTAVSVFQLLSAHGVRLSVLQSGSGGGVGAAAGAAGPTRESQRVLGAPGPGHHCPLLGHQRAQGFCRRLGGQGHLSPSRVL